MDKRSMDYLNKNGIKDCLHIPKKISQHLIDKSELIIPMDTFILSLLIKKFPFSISKLKNFNFYNHGIYIDDPFKLNDEEYLKIMENIKSICYDWKSRL